MYNLVLLFSTYPPFKEHHDRSLRRKVYCMYVYLMPKSNSDSVGGKLVG